MSTEIIVEAPLSYKYKCRYCELENGVGGLMVEDAEASISSIAVGAHVGSYNDPEEVKGLAHFTEHMLFLGTEKYPDEGSYDKFVAASGGSNNAYTSTAATIYHCTVSWEKLEEALDRLAQFFIAPLFTESATDRELHAIDNEFNRTRENGNYKLRSVLRAVCSPANPFHKFSIGNLATLHDTIAAPDLRAALQAFFKKYYHPSVLRVSVVSRAPLDDQEALFRKYFGNVPTRRTPNKSKGGEGSKGSNSGNEEEEEEEEPGYYADERAWAAAGDPAAMFPLGKRVLTAPPAGDETRKMLLLWPMEPMDPKYYREIPLGYYSHLLGHETEGSVAHYLRKQGLAHSLIASPVDYPSVSFFQCDIELTTAGWERRDEVARAVFAYIAMLRTAGPQEWVFREIRDQDAVDFMFGNKPDIEDVAPEICANLLVYPPADTFKRYMMRAWDPELLVRVGALLTPARCFAVYSSAEFADLPGAARTPYYDAPYTIEPLEPALIASWGAADPTEFALHLPDPNPFTPDPARLLAMSKAPHTKSGSESEIVTPEEVFRSERTLVYFKEGRHFETPMIMTEMRVMTPVPSRSPRDIAGLKLLKELFEIACAEWGYYGELARHTVERTVTHTYMGFTTKGYSDKHFCYARRIISELCSFAVGDDPRAFVVAKEKILRKHARWLTNAQPTEIVTTAFAPHQKVGIQPDREVIDALRAFTFEDFAAWYAGFWPAGASLNAVVCGCTTASEARAFAADIDALISAATAANSGKCCSFVPALPQRLFQPGCTVLNVAPTNPANRNSSVSDVYYVTRGFAFPEEVRDVVCAVLLEAIVEPEFYNILRTNEQLGYVVWFYSVSDSFRFLKLVVQSAGHPPDYLEGRIQAFLKDYYPRLQGLSDAEFEAAREGLVTKLLQPPTSVVEEMICTTSAFFSGSFLWDRKRVNAALARTITKDEIVATYERVFLNKDTRRMVSLRVHAKQHQGPDTPPLWDIQELGKGTWDAVKDWPVVPTTPGPRSPEPSTANLTLDKALSLLSSPEKKITQDITK